MLSADIKNIPILFFVQIVNMISKKSVYCPFIIFYLILFNLSGEVTNAQTVYLEWVDDPLKSIVVNWIHQPGGDSSIDYRRVGGGSWSTVAGDTRSIPGASQRLYRVKLANLDSGQGYEFRIDGDNEIYKFRTAPENLDEPIRFVVGGDILDNQNARNDFEKAKSDFEQVSQYAAERDPYFAVLAGDLAHADGNEDFVEQWFDFFEIWHNNMVTDDGFLIPIAASPGNHEVPNGYGDSPDDAIYYYTFFSYPQDQWDSKRSYGTLDFNNYLSVVTLDTDHTHRIPGQQTNWLNNTLRNRRNFRHIIPAYHVAGWPAFDSRTLVGIQENLVRDNWHKVFRDNNIRLVFEHHDHVYKRTRTIGNCDDVIRFAQDCKYGNNAKDGVIYMGGGAWGSENTRGSENRWYLNKTVENNHNFVVVEISNNYRTATAIGENGQEIDSFTDYVFLDPPKPLAADIAQESFTARWEEVDGGEDYLLTIFTDKDYEDIFRDFENKNVGDVTEYEVENLDPSIIYYYNVRAKNVLTTSNSSEIVPIQLVKIDPDLSTLTVSEQILVGDDVENAIITATVFDEDGKLVPNFRVELFTVEGNLEAVDETVTTNDEGVAEFTVFNNRAETVTYGILAGQEEISQKVQISYLPVPPVALSATEVRKREFTANWEMVENADYYLLDVAIDENFSNIVSGYQGLDVGNVTSHNITGVNPGTEYFYRVRAVTNDLIGINSETISTITFPDTPTAVDASDLSVVSFNAKWDVTEGAKNYRLDVARDPNFEQYVQGYENLDVGNVLTYEVEGLLPERDYYYRVKAEAKPRLSDNSNIIQASTYSIDIENSEISSDQLRVLGNGEQSNEILVVIRAENGDLQEGVNVKLIPDSESTEIEEIQPVTNEEGVAKFGITNTRVEKVSYSVVAATVNMGSISLEFLPNEEILSLGNNFPNPFRFDSAIPLTIPHSMHVDLQVFNSLGSPVRTLIDDELETGYYEVPFNGADLAAGVYFYRLRTEEGIKTGKMVLVK